MNFSVLFLFVVLCHDIANGFQCQEKTQGLFDTDNVEGSVQSATSLTLNCGDKSMVQLVVRPIKPSRGRGSSLERGQIAGERTPYAIATVVPVARLIYRCAWGEPPISHFLYGSPLDPIHKTCQRGMLPVMSARAPDPARDLDMKVNLVESCLGKSTCVVEGGVDIATVRYTIDKDCRAKYTAYQCCDTDDAKAHLTELYERRACDANLLCDCCRRSENSIVNIKSCDPQFWLKVKGINLVGLNYEGGIRYGISDDAATDEKPDRDEDGCHVRRAELKVNGEKKQICLPGNMARVLRVVDSFASQHLGKCNILSNKIDKSCKMDIQDDLPYHFGVNVLLPYELTEDWLTVEKFREELFLKLEEEGVDSAFTIKGNTMKQRTNQNGKEFARLVLAFNL